MLARTLPIDMAAMATLAALAPSRKVMLVGESAPRLAAYAAARAACEGKPVRFICGDNRFDPYGVTRFAKQAGVRPEQALRSILVARAFTAHQLAALVDRLTPDTNGLVIVSGPCSTFFDEDVALVEAARLFYRTLWRTVELAGGGLSLLLAQGGAPATGRRAYFLLDLCRAADVTLRLNGRHSFTLEHRRRAALPRLAALDRLIGG